jgi:hypothetical protein
MPLQSTTDAGSETTLMFALANALRYVHCLIPTPTVSILLEQRVFRASS